MQLTISIEMDRATNPLPFSNLQIQAALEGVINDFVAKNATPDDPTPPAEYVVTSGKKGVIEIDLASGLVANYTVNVNPAFNPPTEENTQA